MHKVDITFECIAQTRINPKAMRRWLDRVGAVQTSVPETQPHDLCEKCGGSSIEDWDTNATCSDCFDHPGKLPREVTDAGALCGLCAKRCYMSFEPGLNPNVTRVRKDWYDYLTNILKSKHGCYDGETEVLTSKGWKFWPDVKQSDELATLNPRTNKITYCYPKRMIKYTHKGMMYRIEGKVDLLVTPDHKMLACETTTKKGRKKTNFNLLPAYVLGHTSYACKKDGEWSKTSSLHPSIEETYLKYLWLLGFYIGDGTSQSGTKIEFHLRKLRKINKLIKMFPAVEQRANDKYSYEVAERYWDMFASSEGNQIPQELLTQCTAKQLTALYQGLIDSDGSVDGASIVFDTTNGHLAGQFQQLLLHIGKAGNISQAECYSIRDKSFGDKPIYRVNITSYVRPEVNKKASGNQTHSSYIQDWEGEVYCAEVPNNTLYVRRGGKPVWSGNSVTEHASWTFAIEGVSRVFTGELNRHRAGVGISEGSMRYIRFDDIGFWMPNSLSKDDMSLMPTRKCKACKWLKNMLVEDPPIGSVTHVTCLQCRGTGRINLLDAKEFEHKKEVTRLVFHSGFKEMQDNYKELCSLWGIEEMKAFDTKKKLTSMFRRLIGMGVATGGTWTFNTRALRHVLAMRTSPHAEEEIAHVFSMIGKWIVDSEPALFGDFEQVNGCWVPRNVKI